MDSVRHPAYMMIRKATDAVQLSWQPDVSDYIQAFTARNRARKVWYIVAVVSLIGAAFAIAAIVARQPGPATTGIVVAIGLPVMVPILSRSSTKVLWRRIPALHSPTQSLVSPDAGITTDGPLVDLSSGRIVVTQLPGTVHWQQIQRVLETDQVFVVQLVGHRGKAFFLLAKRGLADPAELDRLRDILLGSGRRDRAKSTQTWNAA